MSLVSTFASVLYAALPRQLRHPCPRPSEALREFDELMKDRSQVELPPGATLDGASPLAVRGPYEGPTRALERRAHH